MFIVQKTAETSALREEGHLLVTASLNEGRELGNPAEPCLTWEELGNMALFSLGFLNLQALKPLTLAASPRAVSLQLS